MNSVSNVASDTPEKMTALLTSTGFLSVRPWTEDLETRIDLPHLVQLRTRVGRNRRRYDSMDAETRRSFLDRARRRMGELPPEAFVHRGTIVYATATRP